MMRIRPSLVVLIVLGVVIVLVAVSAQRLQRAESRLSAALNATGQLQRDAQRIADLRARQQTIADQKRPDQDVIARVNTVLAEAGIPAARFGGLRPEADTALPNPVASGAGGGSGGGAGNIYRRQSVRISLNELSVSELGAFLSRWTISQPLWVPTRIELTHVAGKERSDLYNASMLLSATYVASEGQTS